MSWLVSTSLVGLVALGAMQANPAAAASGAAGLNLVNGTDQAITSLFIRRTGTDAWQPLTVTPPKSPRGGRATSPFKDPDCAFDIRATLDDGNAAVWTRVNLCEVKSLTLNRNAAGVTWADYE